MENSGITSFHSEEHVYYVSNRSLIFNHFFRNLFPRSKKEELKGVAPNKKTLVTPLLIYVINYYYSNPT